MITGISKTKEWTKLSAVAEKLLFPLILLLFPLLKINQGVDLTDTAYSLGNYRFFGDVNGVWILLTFLSNVTGHLLTLLPMGDTMLGMKLYTALFVSAMALLGYRFFKTKMPAWLAFGGEMAAIGLCWCPTAILYNYLTYFLLLLGAVFLFRGLAGARPACLLLAGVFLGLNAMARFPNNVLETALILAVWYYGALKKKEPRQIAGETGLCVAGYLAAFFIMLGVVSVLYGTESFGNMITGVFGMAGSASDYTLGEMLLAILDAYFHGMRWALYLIICILPGIPFLIIREEKLLTARKVLYCLCIPVLFLVLGRWGMYNFNYFQKESALQWGAVFLLIAIGVMLWMLFTPMLDHEWRLIGCIGLIIVLITPLGSNNHIWPVLNNLFFIAPVVFWMVYRLVRWGRTYLDSTGKVPLFPVKAMLAAALIMFLVQAVGVGCFYVFRDGEGGEKRSYLVANNPVLKGMYTSDMNAETLEEISAFMTERRLEYQDKELILYGNIPGIAYYLDKKPAISTTWTDLDTYPASGLAGELEALTTGIEENSLEKPLIILTPQIAAYLSGDQEAMSWWGVSPEDYEKDEKLQSIADFMKENIYQQVYANEAFAVYE